MIIKNLGTVDYSRTLEDMKEFTIARTKDSEDELWVLEHNQVFTQGQAGKPEHILQKSNIPIVQSDRGGQVTYHGPGQLIIYTLIDIKRNKLSIRDIICAIEQAAISLLQEYNINAIGKKDAPGVYVNDAKICSLGLRVKKGCCYHGLSFNVDMDLSPFSFINPCGYSNLKVVQLKDFIDNVDINEISCKLTEILQHKLQLLKHNKTITGVNYV